MPHAVWDEDGLRSFLEKAPWDTDNREGYVKYTDVTFSKGIFSKIPAGVPAGLSWSKDLCVYIQNPVWGNVVDPKEEEAGINKGRQGLLKGEKCNGVGKGGGG